MSSTLILTLLVSVAFIAMLVFIVIILDRMNHSRRTPDRFASKMASSFSPSSNPVSSSSDQRASQTDPGSFQAKGTSSASPPSLLTEAPAQPAQNPSAGSFVQRSRPFASSDRSNRKVDSITLREDEYEKGIQVTYDDNLDIIIVVLGNVVVQTPTEVTAEFQVLYNKVHHLLRTRKKERGTFLTDTCGLVVGREVTAFWRESLKTFFSMTCIEVGRECYLKAVYNSRMQSGTQASMQEKLKRIQLMTPAAINDLQSNIFESREEALAFLIRMRELTLL